MNPVFIALGIADTLVGLSILYPGLAGNFLFYIAFYALAKGALSLLASFAVGYYADWMGFTDIIAGAVLALISFGASFSFFSYIGIFAVIKGVYCAAMPLIYK